MNLSADSMGFVDISLRLCVPGNDPELGDLFSENFGKLPGGVARITGANMTRVNATGTFDMIAMSKTCSGPLSIGWTMPRTFGIGIASRQRPMRRGDAAHGADFSGVKFFRVVFIVIFFGPEHAPPNINTLPHQSLKG